MEILHTSKKRRGARLLAGLLLATLLVGLCPGAGQALDLTGAKGYVRVLSGGDEDMRGDLASAGFVLDVYPVADAVADTLYDAYHFAARAPFEELGDALNNPEIDREAWEALARQALGIVKDGETAATTVEAEAGDAGKAGTVLLSGLEPGLYLLVARNKDVTDKSKYLITEEETLLSAVQTAKYVYRFAPQLLALPLKEGTEDDSGRVTYNTANPGEWLFGTAETPLEIVLKPSRAEGYGDLEIVKTLTGYERKGDESFKPVTFVFEVTVADPNAREGAAPLYSNVTSITISSPAELTKSATLTHIPLGFPAVVREVYTGMNYTQVTGEDGAEQTLTLVAADAKDDKGDPIVNRVSFTDAYNDTGKTGYGILNDFTAAAGHWESNQPKINGTLSAGEG